MALVIEDGTGVTGATSYATVQQIKDYAVARGLSLPADDADIEILAIKAADYLESLEPRFKGSRVSATQALAWPRECVELFGAEFADDAIPPQLIAAQAQLAFDAQDNDLQATGGGQQVTREKVDVIEVEYAESYSATLQAVFNKANSILAPLLNVAYGRTIRV